MWLQFIGSIGKKCILASRSTELSGDKNPWHFQKLSLVIVHYQDFAKTYTVNV